MPTRQTFHRRLGVAAPALLLALWSATDAGAQESAKPVYRCPGPPVLYTDALSAQEAREKGCRTIEGAPITIVPATKPRPASGPAASSRPGEGRVNPAEQRSRDSDARRILADELRREEERLATLRAEYNNGEPERRGDERNYQRYLDRVAEMKAAIARREADIAALKRELAKLPQ
ncbi:MAG: hypothetical protein Q8K96_14230 [Rubrivivax sp.]|nr:hypothetical protein [Rubrivivax sp.]